MGRSWDVAGYGDLGEGSAGWTDVESGGAPADDVADPNDLGSMTIHFVDTDTGDDFYFTVHPPFEDWDQVEDLIDWHLEGYGVEE